ncbi:unnamed protein product, partial [Polarella glacialis]
ATQSALALIHAALAPPPPQRHFADPCNSWTSGSLQEVQEFSRPKYHDIPRAGLQPWVSFHRQPASECGSSSGSSGLGGYCSTAATGQSPLSSQSIQNFGTAARAPWKAAWLTPPGPQPLQ